MTESQSGKEPQQPPADIATLYSWANMHGVKYRDFGDSRQQVRAQNRHRAQSEQDALAREAVEKVAQENSGQIPVPEAPVPLPPAIAAAASERKPEPVPELPSAPQFPAVPAFAAPRAVRPAAGSQPTWRPVPVQQFDFEGESSRWPAALEHDLYSDAQDTLQQSREDVASRWFALKGVFDREDHGDRPAGRRSEHRAPALAVFSIAGGVGKTSLVATLGRVLAAQGERTLLVDTTSYGLLPFYFGARDLRPNTVRTFSCSCEDQPVSVVSLDVERFGRENSERDRMIDEIQRDARGVGRVLIDVQTGSMASMRRLLRLDPVVLVPVVPDMNSVVTLQALNAFFHSQQDSFGQPVQPYFVLNQFDAAVPLHLDVREVLRKQLGDRLLPFSIGRSYSLSEALAEGMTVVDYAPGTAAIEDFSNLATWLQQLSTSNATDFRATRWSER
ncbi:cellulose synthase operon protein YhjQ/BcsQ [Acidipila rosea]|uniref:Cellulose synthase operon protein YhjQ n=1 Tax=Acidipila rosea TaxID=768535 RepID=A0A4R1LC79_9BACT|nr:cellulose synthase operon protein YhjQ/BcsQ [Acidipila rosea]TCK75945.1 cellulose synthase operon protein YhjQ [Acidipila rosea]